MTYTKLKHDVRVETGCKRREVRGKNMHDPVVKSYQMLLGPILN